MRRPTISKHWAEGTVEQLEQGQTVQVRPRGHSMHGRIADGALVTVAPCKAALLQTDDVVLVRIKGRRYSHVVLHQILECENDRFLIGSAQGRVDGWVARDAIYGVVLQVEE